MDGELNVIFRGTSSEKIEIDGSITTAAAVVAYSQLLETVLYGIRIENGGVAADILSPCSPLVAWRCFQLHEHTLEKTGIEEDSLDSEAAVRFVDDLFETIATLEGTFPPTSDIIALWDGISSLSIRTGLAWQLRYALAEGMLIDEDGEVRRRIEEFTREQHNTFPC
jgi:hypothetical protein